MWGRSDCFSVRATGWKTWFPEAEGRLWLTGDRLWGAWQDRNTVGGHFIRIVCGDSGTSESILV